MSNMSNPYDQYKDLTNVDFNNDDSELSIIDKSIESSVTGQLLPDARNLNEFLCNTKYHVEREDANINIFEQGYPFRRLNIPDEDISKFFHYINQMRKSDIRMHWTEKQRAGHEALAACIMIDADIYQEEQKSLLTDQQITYLQNGLCKLFLELFVTQEQDKAMTIYSSVIRKPSVKYDEKRKLYKDGFQLYIFARLSRNAKRFFIKEILERKLFSKAFGKDYKNPESFLDTQCCHVPTLIFGSCKQDSVPKPLWLIYKWEIDCDGSAIVMKDEHFIRSDHILNFCHELSINFEACVIKKLLWQPKPEYIDTVALLSKNAKNTSEEDRQTILDDVNSLIVTDPHAHYLKNVLDCLRPERFNHHKYKFNTVYALIKDNEKYIPLAKLFLKKSHKYTDAKFEKIIEDVRKSKYDLTLENIYGWAAQDSPDKFRQCNDISCSRLMLKYVFDIMNMGKLGHAHFAEILYLVLKNKYKTDREGKQRTWVEFVFPTDPHEKGQIFKWRKITSPDSLNNYIHRKLSELCKNTNEYITKKQKDITDKIADLTSKNLDTSQEKALKVYYDQVMRNFKSSVRGLWIDGFKQGIIKQCECIFDTPGFIKSLDQGEMDLGVANGILQLSYEGKLPKIVKNYNNCKVSRYTNTTYKVFDPKDPLTRKLLLSLRSMHPDDETDAYEYKMSLKAATIDNRPRETIFFLLTGPGSNGKSFEFELHSATLGEYCVQMPVAMLLQSKEENAEGPKPFLMKLEGARAAYYEEGPTCAVLYMPLVKRLTGSSNLPARDLHEKARNIKSRCYHFVLSNHDFIISSHEEAVWRRLRYLKQSVIFKDVLDYDPKNPKHRKIDRTLNAQFIEDEATRSAYLSILVFFHMKLMRYHGGIIEHVPHPTIDRYTADFRNRQDTLNRFITERIVYSPTQETPTPLEKVVAVYCNWYDSNIGAVRHYKQDIIKELMDSALKDVIEQQHQGAFLIKGYRVVDNSEIFDGEEPFITQKNKNTKKKVYSRVYEKETPEEYLDRVEKEWEELLEYEEEKVDLSGTYNYDSDDPDREDGEIEEKKEVEKRDEYVPDNIEDIQLDEDESYFNDIYDDLHEYI